MGVAESAYHYQGFSDSMLCDDKQVQNVHKKPQFKRVAYAQYPSQVKNCIVHVHLSLCVKCCHICDFIMRHLATVKLVLIRPSRRKLIDFKRGQVITCYKTTFPSEK